MFWRSLRWGGPWSFDWVCIGETISVKQ
jgi:hypothetical protein